MDQAAKQKTEGLEKLEFLTDKAKRLIFQLNSEGDTLSKLRTDIRAKGNKRKELSESNTELRKKLSSLQKDKEKVDEKIGNLLSAINDLPLD